MATHSSISCQKNFKDKGTWQATVHGVTNSQTQLRTATTTIMLQCLGLRDVVTLEEIACCDEPSSEHRHNHGYQGNVALKHLPYAKKLFLDCNRETAGSSHLGFKKSKRNALSLEKWLLRTQDIRTLQSKILPTTSFRQTVKNIFKDQHKEIRRNKCNYSQNTTLWNSNFEKLVTGIITQFTFVNFYYTYIDVHQKQWLQGNKWNKKQY